MKQAICYSIQFPQEHDSLNVLVEHLTQTCESLRFVPLSSVSGDSDEGFTALFGTEGLVPLRKDDDAPLFELLSNGFAFAVKMEDKVIPSSALDEETKAAAERIAKATGVVPTREEVRGLRDTVRGTLAAKALSVTKVARGFYEWDAKRLLVPVASDSAADRVVRTLLKAFPSVKSETIHVNSLKDGLATRLQAWVEDPTGDAFAPLDLSGKVTLKGEEGKKITVDAGKVGIESFHEVLRNALELGGMKVESVRLEHVTTGMRFTLTHDFKFKSIDLGAVDREECDNVEDATALLLHDLSVDLLLVSQLVDNVIQMMGWEIGAAKQEEPMF